MHAGYNHEDKQKERKEKTYLLAQPGRHRHRHRQVGGHRKEWAWGKKCGHAQTSACRLQS